MGCKIPDNIHIVLEKAEVNPCRIIVVQVPQYSLVDELCLLIRQHQLDPTLVKRYAAEFCGTAELRDASRPLVEEFIQHLAEWAARDPQGLRCKLNGYTQPQQEVQR